ncbi:MAG: hypothetical protein M3124_07810 [Actinomycetota bacterium]|nr:hypothetical protein [Actinomycetota bacterium]
MIDLERSLTELGARIDWPAETDIGAPVRARIEARQERRRTLGSAAGRARALGLRSGRAHPAIAYAAIVVALVAIATLVALPGVRSAVADFLGLGGVRIERGGRLPRPADELNLGETVTLSEASERVDFDVLIPGELGEPGTVYFDPAVSGGQVALAYEARPGLPAAPGTELGALVTQFSGARADPDALKKVTANDPGTRVVPVIVDGTQGLWISGEPHTIAYLEADGDIRTDTVRLAGNVLLWERDGVTLRLESRLSRSEAVAIAESMS